MRRVGTTHLAMRLQPRHARSRRCQLKAGTEGRSNVRSLRLGPPAHSLGWTPIVTRQGRRCLHEPPPGRRRHAQEATPRHERLPNVPLFSLDAGRLVIARGGFLRCAPSAAGFGQLR